MPKLSPGQPFGPIPASVTLDANGFGSVQFQATGSAVSITNLFGNVAPVPPATDIGAQAVASVYVGTISLTNRVFNNNSGSTGFTATGRIDIPDGTIIYVTWNGGDPGGVATATFSGRAIPFDEIAGGFEMRADDPIAAGDGSLIYPALKSPNYVPGSAGWYIDRLGVAEFLNAVIRGTIDIAGGIVTINNNGVFVEDATHFFSIDIAGGFQAINKPVDGSSVSMQDNAVFFQPIDPYNTFDTFRGFIAAQETNVGGTFVNLTFRSPTVNSQDSATFRLWGRSASGASPPTFDFGSVGTPIDLIRMDQSARITNFNNNEERYGNGWINTTESTGSTSTSGVINAEIIAMTSVSIDFAADRAYRIQSSARYTVSTVPTQPVVQFRKNNLAGTSLMDLGRLNFTTTNTMFHHVDGIFITGGSAVTCAIVMTLTSNVANVFTQAGSATNARSFEIFDIGPASRYPNRTVLT